MNTIRQIRLFLEAGQRLETALESTELTDISAPVGLKTDDIYDLYVAAHDICIDLKISCPQILITEYEEIMCGTRAMLYDGFTGSHSVVLLKPMSFDESIECLAHELRHRWQHEKHEAKYFSNYMLPYAIKDEESRAKYRLQAAEIDAEAFSVRYCVAMGIEKFPIQRDDNEEVNRAIEERAKKMILPTFYSY